MEKYYDMIVIGGGPAGYTAALYGARAGLSTLVLEKIAPGGQMTQTTQIDNYPGFPQGVDGITLGMQMQEGAARFGVESVYASVKSVSLTGEEKQIETAEHTYTAGAVVIATGATHRHLGIEGEQSLTGSGVAYCAACDGMFYRGKRVVVVGGGESAVTDALFLSKIAKEVILVHRRDSLRASATSRNALKKAENVQILWNSRIRKLHAEERLTGVTVENLLTGEQTALEAEGLFISIGRKPETELFENQLSLDAQGYIVAGEDCRTELAGVFAAGDVRTKEFRQIVTAVADGAVAAHQAENYLVKRQVNQ